MKRDDQFLKKHFLINLLPVMLSILGGTINALIDSVFISQRLGPNGLAAVNLCMPIYIVMCSAGALFGSGGYLLSAREEGKDNRKEARDYFKHSVTALLIVSIIATVLGVVFCRELAWVLTGGGELFEYVASYCRMYFIGAIPTTLLYIPIYYLQLEANRNAIYKLSGIMILIDTVLDYLFLFVFNWGMSGAALASVIASLAVCIYGFLSLQKGKGNYGFIVGRLKIRPLLSIIRYGSPAALGNFYDALKLLILNSMILGLGGSSAVALWAVLNTLSEIAMMIIAGVPQTGAPMIGVYSAANENSGIRILFKLELKAGLILTVFYSGIILILNDVIELVFAYNEDLFWALLCLGIFIIFELAGTVWAVFFNVVGRIELSNVLTFLRRLLIPIGALYLTAAMKWYTWIFLPLSAVMTFVITQIIIKIISYRSRNKERPLSQNLLLDDYLERENKVFDFSVNADMESACRASEDISEFCTKNGMDAKRMMRMQLSIEELLSVILQKCPDVATVDLRAIALEGIVGIRIRCAGENYNPFAHVSEDEDFYLGVSMLMKRAEVFRHSYTLGMNTINILFEG